MFDMFTRPQLSQYHELLFMHAQAVFALLFGADLKPRIPVGGSEWARLRAEHDKVLDIMTAVYAEMQRRDHDPDTLTDVPMVCTLCRKPVFYTGGDPARGMVGGTWHHVDPDSPHTGSIIRAMVAAGAPANADGSDHERPMADA